MFHLIVVAFLAILLGMLIRQLYRIKRVNDSIDWVDGPKPSLLLGNALDIKNSTHLLTVMEKYALQYKGIVKMRIGLEMPQLFVSDVELLKLFMTSMKAIDKSPEYGFLHAWLGLGLLTSTGTKWQQRRKLITPTFHFRILEQFVDVFNANSAILTRALRKECGHGAFDVYPYMTLLTLDIVCETAMGIKVNAQLGKDSEYIRATRRMGDIVVARTVSPVKQSAYLYPFTLDAFGERRSLKILHGFTRRVIRERRDELARAKSRSNGDAGVDDDCGIKRRSAFLDTLIGSTVNGRPLTDDDIREEVDTFMFEGHDTTSSALSFTLYALSQHADVQEKVYEEVRSVCGDDADKALTYEDLQRMKYLEMAIKEAMRLYATVPIIGRELTDDIEYGGKIFPKGLTVTLFLFGTHRNPDLYPDPHRYDPERFAAKEQSHPFAYVPFSAGFRNCIGQKFAMLEMKTTISHVLMRYKLLPAVGREPILNSGMILKSNNGVHVKIVERPSTK